MQERPYENEDLLQTLVERHPELLAGDQMNPASPRRWLLISREMAVPDETDGSARWSIDHLFVDQDAIPTLVEVKRSSDTRIRREVVGQMLDYAANGVVYWPAKMMRSQFDGVCRSRNEEPGEVLSHFLGQDGNGDQDAFWEAVDSNLRSGRIRLVFLADQIPTELQRVVEFLNEHMSRVDVIAVELKQFVGQGIQTLVPRLIGQTAAAKQKQEQAIRRKQILDKDTFLATLADGVDKETTDTARRVVDWMQQNTDALTFGTSSAIGSVKLNGKNVNPFLLYSNGMVEVSFGNIRGNSSFRDQGKRTELLEKLNLIMGIKIQQDRIEFFPKFPLSALQNEQALHQFFDVYRWTVDEIKKG
ncbi:MAG TPA: hypothetical protein DCS88_08830 [Alphaproteobacteria bacterium]|nr:hypothetical protein [Alphaproteobacteria bacterium]